MVAHLIEVVQIVGIAVALIPIIGLHGSYHGERIGHNRMSEQEISDYYEGYDENEEIRMP